MLESLKQILSDGADAAVISVMGMIGAMAVIPEWRTNRGYAVAGVVCGVIVGLAAERSGVPGGIAVILTAVGVVTGPITIARIHGNTFGDVLDEIVRRRQNGGIDPEPKKPKKAKEEADDE